MKADPGHKSINVIKLGKSDFTYKKLTQALKDCLAPIAESLKVSANDITPKKDDENVRYTPGMYFSLPANLQSLEREKSQCFKEIVQLRNEFKKIIGFSLPDKIELTEALRQMNQYDKNGNPIPFSIRFITCNIDDNTGGEVLYYKSAFLSYQNKTGTAIYTGENVEKKSKRSVNHWSNGTRNIFNQGGHRLSNIHIWLILELNGKEVIIGQPG